MKSFVNPLAPRSNRLQVKSAEIKAWVRQLTALPENTPVSVAELACRDEGCPDIETVIGIMEADKPIRTVRLHLAIAEVTRDAIAVAVQGMASDDTSRDIR